MTASAQPPLPAAAPASQVPTERDLLNYIRLWGAHNCPGGSLSHIVLHFRGLPVPITLADGLIVPGPVAIEMLTRAVTSTPAVSATPAPPAAPASVEDEQATRQRLQCAADILAVMGAKRRLPMTQTRLVFELKTAGKEHSPRIMSAALAEMVKDGTLENPPDAKPRGYRLPPGVNETPRNAGG
jgi:hypothetical protein